MTGEVLGVTGEAIASPVNMLKYALGWHLQCLVVLAHPSISFYAYMYANKVRFREVTTSISTHPLRAYQLTPFNNIAKY